MGTVGLSFGSPTSGTGINVSSTVATIVSTLQNIETPWKNQLASLQSQDAVISGLGTLLSTVSNDVSQLTDAQGILAQKTGSSSDTSVLQLTSASAAAVAGTHTVVVNSLAKTSSGYLAPISSATDKLSGSITLQVGSGTAHTITLNSSNNTLAGLAAAINSSGAGVTASVLNDANGSRLSLVSGTSGTNGNITISGNSIADVTTSSGPLAYSSTVTGSNASLTVDGVTLSSASNTVTNLIPGLTFQLLATSPSTGGTPESVQVTIANDNTSVASAVNQMVTDLNSLLSAIHTQQGNTSSGTPEPLFGSPTLSLLQQQLISVLNAPNPNGYLTSVVNADNPSLSGSISIQVGSGTARTITLNPSQTSLSDLADAINTANLGVTAGISTVSGQSTLTLVSQTPGAAGALAITSNLVSNAATALTSATFTASGTDNSGTSFSGIASTSDVLAGTLTIQVGAGTGQTVNMSDVQAAQGGATLSDLAQYINTNSATLGVSASIAANGDGTQSLQLTSLTAGSDGNLTVTETLADTTNPTSTNLDYTNSSDLTNLSSIGIGTSSSGGLEFDVSKLDSALNSDFTSVSGFFQNIASWGRNLASTLNFAGASSKTGMLTLATQANSTIEKQLNTKIASQESRISAQQVSLTAELNQANAILQMLPTQLNGINELYAAISGYSSSKNG